MQRNTHFDGHEMASYIMRGAMHPDRHDVDGSHNARSGAHLSFQLSSLEPHSESIVNYCVVAPSCITQKSQSKCISPLGKKPLGLVFAVG